VAPGFGFASFQAAWKKLRGYEIMNMIRKGQPKQVEKEDFRGRGDLTKICLLSPLNNLASIPLLHHRVFFAAELHEFLLKLLWRQNRCP
jgi:hypothetical protein